MIVFFHQYDEKRRASWSPHSPPPYKCKDERGELRTQSCIKKCSILLMKSGEVKTQKQNYFVYSPIPPIRRNFPGASSQIPSFSYLPFSLLARPRSRPLSASQTFHGLMEIRPFLSALTVSFNPLAETRKHPPRTGEETGGKLNDILQKYRYFLFRQTRCRG